MVFLLFQAVLLLILLCWLLLIFPTSNWVVPELSHWDPSLFELFSRLVWPHPCSQFSMPHVFSELPVSHLHSGPLLSTPECVPSTSRLHSVVRERVQSPQQNLGSRVPPPQTPSSPSFITSVNDASIHPISYKCPPFYDWSIQIVRLPYR